MDGFAIKGGFQAVAPTLPAPQQKAGNELPPDRTVNATTKTDRPQLSNRALIEQPAPQKERQAIDVATDNLRRQFDVDPDTSSFVFRVVDESSGNVKRQVPVEALLKLRAYFSQSLQSVSNTADFSANGATVQRNA